MEYERGISFGKTHETKILISHLFFSSNFRYSAYTEEVSPPHRSSINVVHWCGIMCHRIHDANYIRLGIYSMQKNEIPIFMH